MSGVGLSKIFSTELPPLTKEQQAALDQVKATRSTLRDDRFPHQNQASHCWNRYNEWLICAQQNGGDGAGVCASFRQRADSICPGMWLEQWDEARENGSFDGIGGRFDTDKHHH